MDPELLKNDYVCETKKMIVNSFRYNNDKSLICLSTAKGFKVYDAFNYQLLSRPNDSESYNLENVKNCTVLYNTKFIAYLLNDVTDLKCLYFRDDDSNSKIGCLLFKNSISDFHLSSGLIAVLTENDNRCHIFELSSLKYVTSIPDVKSSQQFSMIENLDKKIITIVTASLKNKGQINITHYKSSKQFKKIIGRKKEKINTTFNSIQFLQINSKYITVSSGFGNKIHLYNTDNNKLEFCIFLGNFNYELSNVEFDQKFKFLSIGTNHKYLKIFCLKHLKAMNFNKKDICICKGYDDNSVTNSKKSFNFYFKKMFEKVTPMHCKFKFHDDFNHTMTKFGFENKNIISLIDTNGEIEDLCFDRKKANIINFKRKRLFSEKKRNAMGEEDDDDFPEKTNGNDSNEFSYVTYRATI